MAGGKYTDYNKTLPGVYIRYKTKPDLSATVGERGTVAIAKQLKSGDFGKFIEISDLTKLKDLVGFDITSEDAAFIREMTRGTNLTSGASKILLWRLEEQNSQKAQLQIGNLKIIAKTEGENGNKISIVVNPDVNSKIENVTADKGKYAKWTITTYYDTEKKYEQVVGSFTQDATSEDGRDNNYEIGTIEKLQSNDLVTFSGAGEFTAAVATSLQGGQDSGLKSTAYSDFLKALGKQNFNVVCYDGQDTVVKGVFNSFVKRMCEEEGRYCVVVMANYNTANSEYVISVKNGVQIETGDLLSPEETTWWVAGATAGANYNESLTYHTYPGATDLSEEYENSDLVDIVKEGSFTFIKNDGQIMVLTDINSFHDFTPEKSRSLSKNRVVRVIMQICNDLYLNITKTYLGKVDVNKDGVNLVTGFIIGYLEGLQSNRAIKNFVKEDVSVEEFEIDSMKAGIYIQPVDSLEKIYVDILIG